MQSSDTPIVFKFHSIWIFRFDLSDACRNLHMMWNRSWATSTKAIGNKWFSICPTHHNMIIICSTAFRSGWKVSVADIMQFHEWITVVYRRRQNYKTGKLIQTNGSNIFCYVEHSSQQKRVSQRSIQIRNVFMASGQLVARCHSYDEKVTVMECARNGKTITLHHQTNGIGWK